MLEAAQGLASVMPIAAKIAATVAGAFGLTLSMCRRPRHAPIGALKMLHQVGCRYRRNAVTSRPAIRDGPPMSTKADLSRPRVSLNSPRTGGSHASSMGFPAPIMPIYMPGDQTGEFLATKGTS